jgi:hypothetical protein
MRIDVAHTEGPHEAPRTEVPRSEVPRTGLRRPHITHPDISRNCELHVSMPRAHALPVDVTRANSTSTDDLDGEHRVRPPRRRGRK